MLFQGLEVALRVVGLAGLPAGEIDADEFVGQRAAGLVMLVVMFGFMVVIVALGPRFFGDGTAGVFMEALAAEFGTAVAGMDGFEGAALPDDWRNAIELGDLGRAGKALSISSKGDQEPGSQAWTCSGQATKDGCIGVLVHGQLDLLIQKVNMRELDG